MILLSAAAQAAEALNVESLITDLAFILLLAAITTVLFKWLKQPVVLGYIVAGFLASPNFKYLPSVTTESNIEFWAQLGIVCLLFSLGLEFSFKKLVNAGGSAVVTALIIICGMLSMGWALGHLMGFSSINSIFLGGMLSMSSTTIILKALNDLGLRHRKFASQVLAVLIVEDLFAVLMMVILSSIAINNTVEGTELLLSVGKLVFFLMMWFLVGVYVIPTMLNRFRSYLNEETLLIISMGLCLGMAVFSVMCGFSLALGAFIMGSILASTSFAERIEHVTSSVKDLFGAVFFISVGMMVNPDIIVEYWAPILILSAAVIIGMILFGTAGMLITGQSLLVAMESGFSLVQIGEFSFIIATLGMSLGVLDSSIYPIIVAVSVITTFLTPYFIRMAIPAYKLVERVLPPKAKELLARYAKNASDDSPRSQHLWVVIAKRYIGRTIIYSVILLAISLITLKMALPWLIELIPSWGRLICAVASVSMMSPFLVALTYPAARRSERKKLLSEHSKYSVPMLVMTLFRFLLAWMFLVMVISGIYSQRVGWIVGIIVFILIIAGLSKVFRKRFNDIERRFITNLNEGELRKSGKNNNLINDVHLAYMTVGYGCPFVGERLVNANIRKKYGVNVVNIQRGSSFIPVPTGNERIFPGDTIGVLGTDEEIQNLLKDVEAPENLSLERKGSSSDVKLSSIQLTSNSPILGKTMASSGLREKYATLLVSIQRDGEFIPMSGELTFEDGDVLWLVGEKKELAIIAGKRKQESNRVQ